MGGAEGGMPASTEKAVLWKIRPRAAPDVLRGRNRPLIAAPDVLRGTNRPFIAAPDVPRGTNRSLIAASDVLRGTNRPLIAASDVLLGTNRPLIAAPDVLRGSNRPLFEGRRRAGRRVAWLSAASIRNGFAVQVAREPACWNECSRRIIRSPSAHGWVSGILLFIINRLSPSRFIFSAPISPRALEPKIRNGQPRKARKTRKSKAERATESPMDLHRPLELKHSAVFQPLAVFLSHGTQPASACPEYCFSHITPRSRSSRLGSGFGISTHAFDPPMLELFSIFVA